MGSYCILWCIGWVCSSPAKKTRGSAEPEETAERRKAAEICLRGLGGRKDLARVSKSSARSSE